MIHIHPQALGIEQSSVLYRNVLAEGVLTTTSQTAGGEVGNALGPQTADYWSPAATPAYMIVTLTEAVECDSAAVIGHNIGSMGGTVAVQRDDGTGWSTVWLINPEDDSDILMLFPPQMGIQWRLRVDGPAAIHVSIGMIGPRMLIPLGTRSGYTPITQALNIEMLSNTTRGGQFLGNRVHRIGAATTIPLAEQDADWILYDARDFIRHYDLGRPFIWATSPSELPEDLAYCWRAGDALAANLGPGALKGDLTLNVQAYIGGLNV